MVPWVECGAIVNVPGPKIRWLVTANERTRRAASRHRLPLVSGSKVRMGVAVVLAPQSHIRGRSQSGSGDGPLLVFLNRTLVSGSKVLTGVAAALAPLSSIRGGPQSGPGDGPLLLF